ncbi:MAG: hypothetical protein NWR61_05370 [Pseudomonadales bacterium]|nr:hypothetical protein [Pseudomonadales bacterium]MDP4640631.1 hypothetical protein [Pseudomonadales bacterium]MDP4765759.1 hypothetical protein [Pseudomonadales bacterium]MDP4910352.1 hypothetical protein [Pseudomonadales bacterium]MDP5058117.1 hypothetical protein [Pseudomonadales bacterium]
MTGTAIHLLVLATLWLLPLLATAATSVELRKTYSGKINYIATGKSFRDQDNNGGGASCSFFNPLARSASINLPPGAVIEDAFLYFGASGTLATNLVSGITFNNSPIGTTTGFDEENFEDTSIAGSPFYGFKRDVKSLLVNGNNELKITAAHFDANRTNETCLAAFGVVVIYADPGEASIHVINLFDGFQFFQYNRLALQPRNFVIKAGAIGKMTHISYEGDSTLDDSTSGAWDERFYFEAPDDNNAATLGTPLVNASNPLTNQYNNTVSSPSTPTLIEYGLDIDTYPITAYLAAATNAFEVTTHYEAAQDGVVLTAEVIRIENKAIADIEVFLNTVGGFPANSTNTAQYVISVKNNGDGTGTGAFATGFATGYIHVYDDLPTGISIDSMGDITAPGWDCSATDLGANQLRCSYDLSTLNGAAQKLYAGDFLPDIYVTVDVGAPASPVVNRARVSLCSNLNNIDRCTGYRLKHSAAEQFDTVNNMAPTLVEYPTPTPGQGLFLLDAKSAVNNNVDKKSTVILPANPSNLSTSSKTVVDNNGAALGPGDQLTYTITLRETSSPSVAATGVSITDVIDTDSIFQPGSGTSTCAGPAAFDFSAGTLTVTNMTVAAGGTCTVQYQVNVKAATAAGVGIDNTAIIVAGNGTGATKSSPTQLVAGTATGSKLLYLDTLNTGSRTLKRTIPATDTTIDLTNGSSASMDLSPAVATTLAVSSGTVPVSVWVEAQTAGTYTLRADLTYNNGTVIGNNTISNVTMATGSANAQLFTFQINAAAFNITTGATPRFTLTLTNSSGAGKTATIHSRLQGTVSNVALQTTSVINVDSVEFYADIGRTQLTSAFEAGKTVYIKAVVSDPFGAYDITGARLTLIDPNLANQVTNQAMTVASSTASTRTFYYDYVVPAASSIDPGTWIAQITAAEGAEGTITHTEVNTFATTAPAVAVAYTVNPLTAVSGDTLTYTITLSNAGAAATNVSINQPGPVGTSGLVITSLPSGTNSSTATQINLADITVPATGSTVIIYTVVVQPGAVPGTLINHTITLNTGVSAIAPSVLLDPFVAMSGNKLLYAANMASSPVLRRTKPVTDSTRSITSQGGNATLTLAPVLQTNLNLNAGTIQSGIWVSRGISFAGQRNIQATLGYTGASVGTIGSSSVTIQLKEGVAGAQYLPFNFVLASPLTLLANTSLTLTITNNTAISGETILVHSFKDLSHPSQVALNADAPISVDSITAYDGDIDSGGVPITAAGAGDTIWVVATASDAFGAADISAASLTITDPAAVVTLPAASMTLPTTQPGGAQRIFQRSYMLTSTLGDWTLAVTAKEGLEDTMTATHSIAFNVNDSNPVLTDSYKTVINTSTGNNADTNAGDILHYSITLLETGGASATGVSVTDPIPAGTTFVPGSLTIDSVVQPDPAPDINLTGLTVLANSTLLVKFDVTVNGPGLPGTLISNAATITNPGGAASSIIVAAEDIVIAGAPATGTKLLYLENLDTVPFMTRLQPAASGTADSIVLQGIDQPTANSVTLDLDIALQKDTNINAGTAALTLRALGVGRDNRSRQVRVDLGYHSGGTVTSLGTTTQSLNLLTGSVSTLVYTIPVAATLIPAGNRLQIVITNIATNTNDDMQIYSFDSGTNRSNLALLPAPVINVDAITFWSATMGAGVPVTNPDPAGADVDVYARIVISDPFGEADIQAPDDLLNPTTVIVTDPAAAIGGVSGSVGCTAPCYAYAGEDLTNDLDGATRTFYYIIRVNADPPSNRGTWTTQVTANEGLEVGVVSHTAAASFSTLLQANLSTSTKTWTHAGDVDPGETLTYTISLINTGGIDANNVTFEDVLQTSPVTLTYASAATTCTNALGAPLASPTFSNPVVSLANISVTAGGSCTITINTTVGPGTPGDVINNTATITNPLGTSGSPSASTIFLSASAVPSTGSKQLYLDGLAGATGALTRTPPSVSQATLAEATGFKVLNLVAPTLRAMTLQAGQIVFNVYLSSTSNRNYATAFQVTINTNDGNPDLVLDSGPVVLPLTDTQALFTVSVTNPAARLLPIGSTVQIRIDNDESGRGNREMLVHQVASAPYSELVLPVAGAIEVTSVAFYDGPAAATPNLVTEISQGATAYVQATIQDAFGSSDVNSGCPDGSLPNNNCPLITITDATGADQTPASPANQMTFVSENPSAGSRTYELPFIPGGGMGFDGIWTVEVLGSEGNEQVLTDTRLEAIVVGQPVLTILKSVAGITTPGQVVTYQNNVANTGTATAFSIVLTNSVPQFLAMELNNDLGNWSAVYFLSPGVTISAETFDDGTGTFTYDPNAGACGTAGVDPSPCYDPAIRSWRANIMESMPVSGNLIQRYRAMIE